MNLSPDARTCRTRSSRGAKWRLIAAAAAVPLLAILPARTARAQFPVANAGHANDANNQVGSGGYNNSTRTGGSITNGNIIYNNLTGNSGFRGGLQETDALSFRGRTGGFGLDRFTAVSNPAAVRGTPSANAVAPTAQPFYGESRGVVPPGYVSTVGGSGYVPAGSNQASSYAVGSLPNGTTGGAFRTGAGVLPPNGSLMTGNVNPTYGINGAYAPYGVEAVRLGPTDASNQQTLLAVSPLSGIQQLPLDNSAEGYFSSRTNTRTGLGADRFQHLDPQQLRQMQQELEQGLPLNQPNQINNSLDQGLNGQQPLNPNQLNKPLPQALETPGPQILNNPTLNSQVGPAQPLSSGVQTQEGIRRTLAGAAQQTPVYDELRQRLDRYQGHTETAEEANATFERQRAVRDNAAKAKSGTPETPGAPGAHGAPGVPGAPATPGSIGGAGGAGPAGGTGRVPTSPGTSSAAGRPGVPGIPGAPGPITPGRAADTSGLGALAGGTKTEPVHISSLATGVRAKGLSGLLKSAEDLMKQGKFTSAIEQYTLAERVAPNNPLIPVGQANAELGALSYRDAEQHLRQAFAGDPALLHAQFDLNAFLGEKRVAVIADDLKNLAQKEPKSEMPAFLLAYVTYNTGHEAEAMNYLTEVEKREGKADPVVQRMREHWYVPPTHAAPGGPALNK